MPIMILVRYVIGFVAGYFNEYPQISYGIVGMEGLFLVYIIIQRPYKSTFENARGIINETALVFVTVTNMYYRNFSEAL
jgi:hypothetical protein